MGYDSSVVLDMPLKVGKEQDCDKAEASSVLLKSRWPKERGKKEKWKSHPDAYCKL
jgi:hypothetical protein